MVKAFPAISRTYRELVCTVGITEKGKLIRLYLVQFRYLHLSKQYKKYQWIEADIQRHSRDNRIDSYRPEQKSIKLLGPALPAGTWKERKRVIIPMVSKSLEEIEKNFRDKKISLGLFKPASISFKAEAASDGWNRAQEDVLKQQSLFGPKPKPLAKIPFKFSYEITCASPECRGHQLAIIDWEIMELYRKLKDNYQYSTDTILEKLKQKYEQQMWGPKKDSYLIVGSHSLYPTFMVLGVFWPPK